MITDGLRRADLCGTRRMLPPATPPQLHLSQRQHCQLEWSTAQDGQRLQNQSCFTLVVHCYNGERFWSAAQSLPRLPYHHLWLPNGLYSENLTHSVLRVVWTVIKNQSSMTIAELILQRIQDEQELGICELKNYFSQDWVFLIFF